MPKYEVLSPELVARMALDRQEGAEARMGYDSASVIRRKSIPTDNASIWRPPFVHDIDKILHCPFYNRYTDKTQVFSLIKNDDITRRSLHVQLVSRISRTIGAALGLNLNLIAGTGLATFSAGVICNTTILPVKSVEGSRPASRLKRHTTYCFLSASGTTT